MIFFFEEREYGDIMLMKRAKKLCSTAAKDSLNFKSKAPLSITFALLPLKVKVSTSRKNGKSA